jgi:hypothetical protein
MPFLSKPPADRWWVSTDYRLTLVCTVKPWSRPHALHQVRSGFSSTADSLTFIVFIPSSQAAFDCKTVCYHPSIFSFTVCSHSIFRYTKHQAITSDINSNKTTVEQSLKTTNQSSFTFRTGSDVLVTLELCVTVHSTEWMDKVGGITLLDPSVATECLPRLLSIREVQIWVRRPVILIEVFVEQFWDSTFVTTASFHTLSLIVINYRAIRSCTVWGNDCAVK